MIPSLVADGLQDALVEYLSTTFAIGDPETQNALVDFFRDPEEGIFRGPYVDVGTPFRKVDEDWSAPLGWTPDFRPYIHQARAWERLDSANGRPLPTIVTTGTGSGKTEAFLVPILDHCRRAVARDERGIKAIVLYPMNALASDQAQRLARYVADNPALEGIRAGVYLGGDGVVERMRPDAVIDSRTAMRGKPPDILLTNYKMLDLLLQRHKDHELWTANDPETLGFVVLDELHTYDGARGSDVAMLLRRLGTRLEMAAPGQPLGGAVPIATSATLGAEADRPEQLRAFAEKVFGTKFGEASVIGEERQTVDEACTRVVDGEAVARVDFELPIPDPADVNGCDPEDLNAVAALFTDKTSLGAVELGEVLLGHTLTRGVLAATADGHAHLERVVDNVVARAPTWGKLAQADPEEVGEALARYLALLSVARRSPGPGENQDPLFTVDVQLWVREVSRLLRDVHPEPRFRWADAAPDDLDRDQPASPLPAIYCRHCGRTGWQTVVSDADPHAYDHRTRRIYQATVHSSRLVRTLIRAHPDEPGVRWLDPSTLRGEARPADNRIPVLATPGESEARNEVCPSCEAEQAVRYLGSRVASLASVTISQLFASPHVERHEQKLLAFTDSVQDAAHRSGFFVGRTYRFNLRSVLAGLVVERDEVPLAELASSVLQLADERPNSMEARHALVPPDLLYDDAVRTVWTDEPAREGLERLTDRLAFEAHLELGLWSRFGRTLELTRSVTASIEIPDLEHTVGLVDEARQHLGVLDTGDPYVFVLGLLERLRTRGAIWHTWLEKYADNDGALWHIWGGRPDGMPPFIRGRSRPIFTTSSPAGSHPFDAISPTGTAATWMTDWAGRTMGAKGYEAAELVRRTLHLLAEGDGSVEARTSRSGADVFGLDPRDIVVQDVPEDPAHGIAPSLVACVVCAHQRAAPAHDRDRILGTTCLRYRCPGTYEDLPVDEDQLYYRRLYRRGRLQRVVAAPHTAVLKRDEREKLERAFTSGDSPDAPNVLTCTSTLELGIDIGDLSALLLTSVPPSVASYRQRTGRAGRHGGNALVTTFASTNPLELYHLEQPQHMLTGPVTPPDCYLEAVEILRRQFLAYLIDRAAAGQIDAGPEPRRVIKLVQGLDNADGWMRRIVERANEHIDDFLGLFSGRLTAATEEQLREFAAGGIAGTVKHAFEIWKRNFGELERRRDRLKHRIEDLEARLDAEPELEDDLASVRGERGAVVRQLQDARRENALTALARVGLTPNYTLYDDTVALEASLWRPVEDGFETRNYSFSRPAVAAITELAPGNVYYVGGFRLVIDGLDLGSAQQPGTEHLRACPECAYLTGDNDVRSCPRCGAGAIDDAGAVHQVLRPAVVHCQDAEEHARAFDERDERERRPYELVTSVDVDPADVVQAHQHHNRTFGTELVRPATIRHLNLGRSNQPGEHVRIAGQDRQAARFVTCRHCGVVKGAQEQGRSGRDEIRHRGWCKTRSGAAAEQWEHLLLLHELRTEAIRLLLPVTTFDIQPRLLSFKAALLLGLRQSFGGDPEHLRVTVADFPAYGDTRRRFLVLYDKIPGGTGYLARLADPERLRDLLSSARDAIATCPCRDEGRPACHRCLLGVVPSRDIEDVRRSHALDLLDQVLGDWEVEPVASVADIPVDIVEESELERLFRRGIRTWATECEDVELAAAPGHGSTAFELRFPTDTGTIRWLVRDQVDLHTDPSTVADFVFTRQDANAPEVAVYTDGYAFHASPDPYRVDGDADKRAGVRASGRLVWSLTYDDVTAFHEAGGDTARHPLGVELLPPGLRSAAQQLHHDRVQTDPDVELGRPDFHNVDRNPVAQLLAFLAAPDVRGWGELAASVLAATFTDGTSLRAEEVLGIVEDALRGNAPSIADRASSRSEGQGVDTVDEGRSAGDYRHAVLPLAGWNATVLLDTRPPHSPNDLRLTVLAVLPDAPAQRQDRQAFEPAWAGWLHLANLVQFLVADSQPGRHAVIHTSTSAEALDPADLMLVPAAGAPAAAPVSPDEGQRLDPKVEQELELILDDTAQTLARTAVAQGAHPPTVGYEIDGWPLEVAWPQEAVAILLADQDEPDLREALERDGWQVRTPDEWNPDDLIDAVGGR